MSSPGSGKTTIGRKLEAHFNTLGVKNYLLDGDEVRDLFDRDLGYTSFFMLICRSFFR